MAKEDSRNKFLIMVIAVIVVVFIAYIIGTQQVSKTIEQTTSKTDIVMFTVRWLMNGEQIGTSMWATNWTAICNDCKNYPTACKGSMMKFSSIVNWQRDIGEGSILTKAQCKFIFEDRTYPDSGFMSLNQEETDMELNLFNAIFNEDNQITLCCGYPDYKESCKTTTLSAKCT